MARESSIHGQPSPPRSAHGDHQLKEFDHHPVSTTPYDTPPMRSTHFFAYGDPEEYSLQHQDAYHNQNNFLPERTYRTPPQPIGEGGIQTRSGRSLGTPTTVDSPSSRTSQSPGRQRRNKKGKDKRVEYKIDKPLSTLTEEYDVPVEDMMAWVNRPNEERWAEVQSKHKNKIPRPMNSFMLYRRAYKERIKRWGAQGDNNQLISSVAGISWNLEPRELKEFYAQIADIERQNHSKAFPDYKFTPNKTVRKRDRDNDENESDPDWDDGSAYSSKRQRGRDNRSGRSRSSTPAQVMYDSPPYHPSSYQASNPHMMPMDPYEHWLHPSQYDQVYQYAQLSYPRNPHFLAFGPTSVPTQQDPYMSPLVGLPPTGETTDDGYAYQPDFAIDPSLSDYPAAMSYRYGSFSGVIHSEELHRNQTMYGDGTDTVVHPGLQTLAPAETAWSTSNRMGNVFDAELNRWHAET